MWKCFCITKKGHYAPVDSYTSIPFPISSRLCKRGVEQRRKQLVCWKIKVTKKIIDSIHDDTNTNSAQILT